MMISPAQYVEQFKDAPYLELLKIKNDLVSDISKFEHNYDYDSQDWNVSPSPEVQYQWNLDALGLIASMFSEAFNKEYAYGVKYVSDYWDDMKMFYED